MCTPCIQSVSFLCVFSLCFYTVYSIMFHSSMSFHGYAKNPTLHLSSNNVHFSLCPHTMHWIKCHSSVSVLFSLFLKHTFIQAPLCCVIFSFYTMYVTMFHSSVFFYGYVKNYPHFTYLPTMHIFLYVSTLYIESNSILFFCVPFFLCLQHAFNEQVTFLSK